MFDGGMGIRVKWAGRWGRMRGGGWGGGGVVSPV